MKMLLNTEMGRRGVEVKFFLKIHTDKVSQLGGQLSELNLADLFIQGN